MAGKSILIVDDDREWANLLSMHLRSLGFKTGVSFDAMQGTMNAIRDIPDLILLDINMPAGGGINALKRIRDSAKTNLIPVIVMTARQDPETKAEAERYGITAIFYKPLNLDELSEKISDILKNA